MNCPYCGSPMLLGSLCIRPLCPATGGLGGNWSTNTAQNGNPFAAAGQIAGADAALAQRQALIAAAQQNTAGTLFGTSTYYGNLPQQLGLQPPPVLQSEPPEALSNDGIDVGELVGHRIWLVDSGYLKSVSHRTAWMPGEPMEGKPGDHDYAGVWAFKSPHDALHKMLETTRSVMGSVWLWGDYVEHTIGYRAQFAEVRSLDAHNFGNASGMRLWHRLRHRLRRPFDPRLAELRQRYCLLEETR